MSIAVRYWTQTELEQVKTDKWLATLLMNATTLDEKMKKAYPYNQRRTYKALFIDDIDGGEYIVKIYAANEKMLLKFIDAEYNQRPNELYQVITQYRPINIKQ